MVSVVTNMDSMNASKKNDSALRVTKNHNKENKQKMPFCSDNDAGEFIHLLKHHS